MVTLTTIAEATQTAVEYIFEGDKFYLELDFEQNKNLANLFGTLEVIGVPITCYFLGGGEDIGLKDLSSPYVSGWKPL